MQSVTAKYRVRTSSISELFSILCTLHRRAELTELIDWVDRKRLAEVQRAYESRLGDEEGRLMKATITTPTLTRFAHVLYFLKKTLLPRPRYYIGYAAKYRNDYLIGDSKKTYRY